MCTNRAVNAVGADDGICGGCGTVFEVDSNWTVVLFFKKGNSFIEVCSLARYDFDELVQEVSPMNALLASGIDLLVDYLALLLAFTLENNPESVNSPSTQNEG